MTCQECKGSDGIKSLRNTVLEVHASVEHDPVAGSRSNRILQFRTGSGFDWILKKNSTRSDMDIQTALITSVICLIRVFSDINRIGSNILTGLPD